MSNTLDQIISGSQLKPGYTFIDADTIKDDAGQSYRIQGFDAPEIAKWAEDGEQYDRATAGGFQANKRIQDLAKEQGFTNIVPTGRMDATGQREMIDLQNERGESFTTKLLQSGALRTGKYTTQEDVDAVRVAELFRDQANEGQQEWFNAGNDIAAAIERQAGTDLEFKQQALDELQYAAGGSNRFSSAVQFRAGDRTINNVATNPFSEAWDTGWKGVTEAAYGAANMAGDVTGINWLEELGDSGVKRAQARIIGNAQFKTDWKEVDDVGSAFEYLTNNLAMSVPYMAVTIGGSVAAPFTGGLSLAAPVSIYAGQTWNAQEEKNAGAAITSGALQAILDRVGLKGIVSASGAPKKVLNDAIENLVKKGVSREAAKEQVMNASRQTVAGFAGDAVKVAKDQLAKKALAVETLKKAGLAAGVEGGTEALQETIGYFGENWNQDRVEWDELQDRIINASIAGASLGGTFGAAGSVYDAGQWADVAYRLAPADAKNISQAGRYAEQEIAQNGYVPTIQELATENRQKAEASVSLHDRTEAHNASKEERDFKDTLMDAVTSIPSLWRGSTRWIFKPEIQQKSRAARILADMFGGNLQRTFSGSSFENRKHHIVSKYKNGVPIPDHVWQVFGGGKRPTRKRRAEISNQLYTMANQFTDADGRFNADLIPADLPNREQFIELGHKVNALSDQMWNDQKQFNPDLGYIPNYLFRYKAFDKAAVHSMKPEFVSALVKEYGMNEAEASRIADEIANNPEVNDVEEAFSVTTGIPRPGSHKKRTLNLAENPAFKPFMQQDLFANISQAAKQAARYQAYEEFVGKDGSHIAKLLDQMVAEGVDPKEVNKIAKQMKDYLDAESGNYNRPESEFGKTLEKVQKNFMFLSTVSGLGLATLSSITEMALTMKGLTTEQIFKKDGGINALASEAARSMWQAMEEVGGKRVKQRSAAQERLQELGFYDWDVGAATTTGATETTAWRQDLMQSYFKWIGLQGYTQYTRAVRASMAGDYIFNHLDTIRGSQGVKTNEVQQAEESLRILGLDPRRLMDLVDKRHLNEQQEQVLADMMREAEYNFVNEAIALPQSANRPLIYQDPRFALFTQFQGFISTFTANHIPKLWGEYIKRGSPAMKYNTFALMMTMIALGFVSQHLKDLLKYGAESPYLDEAEYIRRGIFSSGLLGSSERVIDTIFPIYDEKTDGTAEWIWSETRGQSPSLTNVGKLGGIAGDVITGDVSGAARDAARFIPGFGQSPVVRDVFSNIGSAWDFKGE